MRQRGDHREVDPGSHCTVPNAVAKDAHILRHPRHASGNLTRSTDCSSCGRHLPVQSWKYHRHICELPSQNVMQQNADARPPLEIRSQGRRATLVNTCHLKFDFKIRNSAQTTHNDGCLLLAGQICQQAGERQYANRCGDRAVVTQTLYLASHKRCPFLNDSNGPFPALDATATINSSPRRAARR